MIKTKENQNGCASSNNLKEKEYTLKASSIQSFCLNLHFESTATAMTVLPPTPYYIRTWFLFLYYLKGSGHAIFDNFSTPHSDDCITLLYNTRVMQ